MIFQIRIETETPYQNLTHHADTRPPTTKFENPIEKKKTMYNKEIRQRSNVIYLKANSLNYSERLKKLENK